MAKIKLIGFTGEVPKVIPRLLLDTGSQYSENVRLDDGGLTPIRALREKHTFSGEGTIQTIYKHGEDWLSWEAVVDAAPGPVATDRLYYTGDGAPKMRSGDVVYPLAVPFPSAALTATLSGFSSREYAFTYVDTSDVESPASPSVTFTEYNENRRPVIKDFEAVPSGMEKQRLYRKVSGTWYYLGERAASQNDWIDGYDSPTADAPPATSTIDAPAVAPTVSYDVIQSATTRIYVYTWVTALGEESEPCPASDGVDWEPGMTVTLSGFQATPTGRNITKQRIYRSQDSVSYGANLYLIEERTAGTGSYIDNHEPSDFSESLPSVDWNAPPSDMHGLISLPNGMMAAISGKNVVFCEPWKPHAWPEKYYIALDYAPVALGAFGNYVVVATDGMPYMLNGTSPDTMQAEKLELMAPCINPRGVVDLGTCIAYPSHDGLVLVSSSGLAIATQSVMTRDEWLKTNPRIYVAGQFAGKYIASYAYVDAGNYKEGAIIFDVTGQQQFVHRAAIRFSACWYNVSEGALYVLKDRTIYEFDAIGELNSAMSWKSKPFILPAPSSFGCIFIESSNLTDDEIEAIQDQIEEIEAENAIIFTRESITGEVNSSAVNAYAANGDDMLMAKLQANYIAVEIYADSKLLTTISESNTVKRIPPACARTWEFRVLGTLPVAQITLATTARELNEV